MRRDFTKYAMFYAGAQKNLGPSGVTLVCMRDELLQKANSELPTLLNYQTQAGKKSLFNTPPSLAIYIMKLVLEWVKSQGGLAGVSGSTPRRRTLSTE
jgi:phosphoserine aminotransferase